jgi:hypothetical protein
MTKVLSLRVADDLAEWAEAYSKERGVTKQALLEEGLRGFKDDCERGVPEVRVRVAPSGVGACPKNAEGHVLAEASRDPRRSCVHCGRPGRDNVEAKETGGFFGEATMARADFFSGLRFPESANGKPVRA